LAFLVTSFPALFSCVSFGNRVTRSGEFAPIGQLFTLGSFLIYIQILYKFCACFFRINFDKKRVGLHFRRFLAISSGAPCLETFSIPSVGSFTRRHRHHPKPTDSVGVSLSGRSQQSLKF
jgi:hypothetical protein